MRQRMRSFLKKGYASDWIQSRISIRPGIHHCPLLRLVVRHLLSYSPCLLLLSLCLLPSFALRHLPLPIVQRISLTTSLFVFSHTFPISPVPFLSTADQRSCSVFWVSTHFRLRGYFADETPAVIKEYNQGTIHSKIPLLVTLLSVL